MTAFAANLTSTLIKTGYSDDAAKFNSLLSSHEGSYFFTFPSKSKKMLVLGDYNCDFFKKIDSLPANRNFYFCFYDKDNTLKAYCGYSDEVTEIRPSTNEGGTERVVLLKDILNYEEGDSCYYIPKNEGSSYTFSLEEKEGSYVLRISKTK